MSSSHPTNIGYAGSLASRLNEQRKSGGAFCDVLLKVCGQTLPTHACVLSACSPFFYGLICADRPQPPHLTQVPQEIELRIPASCVDTALDAAITADAGLETVLQLLDYIYTGKIELSKGSVHLMVKLADTFMLDGLTDLVRNYVPIKASGTCVKVQGNTSSVNKILKDQRKRKKVSPRKLAVVFRFQKSAGNKVEEQLSSDKDTEVKPAAPVQPSTRALRSRQRSACLKPSSDATDDVTEKRRRSTGTYKCGQCNFVSSDAPAVRDHKLIHARSKSFVCRSCGFFSGHCAKMLEHLLSADHVDTSCCLCGTVLDDRTALVEHLHKHQHRKPFFCPLCDARFRAPSLLARHTVRHSANRPFVCDVCGRVFKRKHFLRLHILNHGAVKSFACSRCDYRTSFKSNLSMHVRIHEEGKLRCPREGCTFQSTSKYNLQSHLLTHAKQKLFQCEVCGEKFAQERNRRRHARRHNPDLMLCCDRCPFATVRPDRLAEHGRRIHENGPPLPSRTRKRRREPPAVTMPIEVSLPPQTPSPSGSRQIHDVWQPQPQIHSPPLAVNAPTQLVGGEGSCLSMIGMEMFPPRIWYH